MKFRKLLQSLLLLMSFAYGSVSYAQFTSVTATITDTDSQTWNNGTWSATLYNPFPQSPPSINGTPLTPSQLNLSGVLSSSGVLTASMADNTVVAPAGTYWQFVIKPNASVQASTATSPVSGSTQNLSTQLSNQVKVIRFPASPTSFGYLDGEVAPIPNPGGIYYNVTTPIGRVWTGTAWTNSGGGSGGINQLTGDATAGPGTGSQALTLATVLGSPGTCGSVNSSCQLIVNGKGLVTGLAVIPLPGVFQQVQTLYGFGDSYIAGNGATNPVATSAFGLLNFSSGANSINAGAGGTVMETIVNSSFNDFVPNAIIPSVSFDDGGANNGCFTAVCLIDYRNTMAAMIGWTTIPQPFRQLASVAATTGTWVPDNAVVFANQPFNSPGTAQHTSSSGATLTYSVPSSASTKIGYTWFVNSSGVSGSFTLSVDGVLQTDNCSSTTTFSMNSCGGLSGISVSVYRQEFTVTPNITHTVIVTNTGGANNLSSVSVDWLPPSTAQAINAVFFMGVNLNFAPQAAAFNPVAISEVGILQADGLPVFYVDQINGTPGVNNTTDLSTSQTILCPASTQGGHPNDCGYTHMYQTVVNTGIAHNFVFGLYQGGGKSFQFNPVAQSPYENLTSTLSHQAAFANLNLNLNTPVGVDLYNNYGFHAGGVAFYEDQSSSLPYSGHFIQSSWVTPSLAGWSCVSSLSDNTNLSNSFFTGRACWDTTTGNGYQLGSQSATDVIARNLGNSTLPTCPNGTSNALTTVGCTAGLIGTTGSIGGGSLTAGTCASGTATVTGAIVGHTVAVSASDGTLPNSLATLSAAVTATNTVTVQVCAIAIVTPTAKTYNVSVF